MTASHFDHSMTTGNRTATAILVEDEPLARNYLRGLLRELRWIDLVAEAEDGPAGLRAAELHRPDVVFVDIELPGFGGLEVLRRLDYEPHAVVTTAYSQHALAAYDFRTVDYLVKPFDDARFYRTLRKLRLSLGGVRERSEPKASDRLFVREGSRLIPVEVPDLVRLEAKGDYVRVHLAEGSLLASGPLARFQERLDPDAFCRVHRSHLVHLRHATALERFDASRIQVRLTDGSIVVASKVGSRALRERLGLSRIV